MLHVYAEGKQAYPDGNGTILSEESIMARCRYAEHGRVSPEQKHA